MTASRISTAALQHHALGNGKRLLRLALLVCVVWLIATHVDFSEVRRTFSRLEPRYLIPVVLVLGPLAVLFRSLRWRRLVPGGKHVPLSSYLRAYILGVLANLLLIGKFGDLVKAKLICDSRLDYGRSVAAVLIDRLMEGLSLMLVFAVVLLNSSLPWWAYQLACVGAFASLTALVALRLLFSNQNRLLKAIQYMVDRLPVFVRGVLMRMTDRLLAGCEALADWRRVLVAFLWSMGVWAVEIATVMVFLTAFSVPVPRFLAAIVVLVVLNFGVLVPISPGSVGVYQFLCVFALSLWGVNRQLAFSFGIAMQTVLFVPIYLAGLLLMMMSMWKKDRSPERIASGKVNLSASFIRWIRGEAR